MITAKALKPTSQSQSQPTREDYVESEQQKRRIVPLAFLLFLTGCAAYLKSFLPVKLEARESQQANKHDDGDQSDPRLEDEIVASAEGAAAEEDVATKSAERNTESSDKVVPIRIAYDNDDNLANGSPAIEPAPPFSLRVATGAIGDVVRTSNNNRPSAPSSSGGGGGARWRWRWRWWWWWRPAVGPAQFGSTRHHAAGSTRHDGAGSHSQPSAANEWTGTIAGFGRWPGIDAFRAGFVGR